jgi:hypothetical protein
MVWVCIPVGYSHGGEFIPALYMYSFFGNICWAIWFLFVGLWLYELG